MAAKSLARIANRLTPLDLPSGTRAALNSSRRIRSRMAAEDALTGSCGSSFSTMSRSVPSHMSAPKPPCDAVKVPVVSGSIACRLPIFTPEGRCVAATGSTELAAAGSPGGFAGGVGARAGGWDGTAAGTAGEEAPGGGASFCGGVRRIG